ncbi:unnamed protein product [Didymodactylos carnosus]|uniref:Uncharacterized protein n=1 Tax=Didymodactylos carnosus TaxID=1234261 RepID=A0A815P085_9BILA|nr:unnamed protein product [Didymodactylos carnosus]CAF4315489.1 unnamed protein product [Didymodactylos carnosus]
MGSHGGRIRNYQSDALLTHSIVFAYNTGKHATTEFSPYQLQFGRHPNLPPDPPIATYEFSKPNDYFQFFRRTLPLYHRRANPQFTVGDRVLKRVSTSKTKFLSLYSDLMIIIKAQHPTY